MAKAKKLSVKAAAATLKPGKKFPGATAAFSPPLKGKRGKKGKSKMPKMSAY